jgi:hypothetical protein
MAEENKTGKKKPNTCQANRDDSSISKEYCGRLLFDDKHCIFHSEDLEKKKKKFNNAFWKELERQKKEDKLYDFSYFIFPDSINFDIDIINFEKDVYFDCAKFLGGNTSFNLVNFSGTDTSFQRTKFTGFTSFNNTVFLSKHTTFFEAEFSNGYHEFIGTKFLSEWTNFEKVKLLGDAEDFNFFNSYIKDVNYLKDALTYKTKLLKRVKYRIKDFRFRLGEEAATKYPEINRMTKDAWFLNDFKNNHPFIYKLWKLTSNCGRSILRWAAWALGIAGLFAVVYMLIGPEAFNPRDYTWFSWFYYSIVTFTTLGFGDITPIKWSSEILVTIEVIFGYVMLGGLISIFANKLARRS